MGEMPSGTQAKLLRVLEERKFRRLGARTEQDVDVRVLAATNRDPRQAVAEGHLRADLFYRLNVFNVAMPPLREHMEDLPAMVEAMVSEMNEKHGRRVSGVSRIDAGPADGLQLAGQRARAAQHHRARGGSLPGWRAAGCRPPAAGIRQGSDAGELAALDGNSITVRVGTTVDEAERLLILRTLEATGQNKTRAAEILGVSLKTLHNKLKEYSRQRQRLSLTDRTDDPCA